ncbi:cupredoxin domain-containing protein [Undibacterium sp. CY18W]|uniref:Nitrous-oxide reductase n=1 Tax=Undibacterium hunanense TaxID=2762292 RepID=A0ABR6ZYL7_9BURK|nr:cupredoxin domain-containing protein [Undibacterium hunanense]MBC3920655.1 cupredoxin domain-containing protein [Undibacterium hunanense]
MNTSRRLFCTGMSLTLLSATAAMTWSQLAVAQGNTKKHVIPVKAQKFSFTPNRIEVRVGETIVLALSALDFPHGFNLPDFNLRRDLVPGKVINVELKADKPGEYDFLCDNFCGDGHEGMSGKLIIKT